MKKKILVIDDEPHILLMVAKRLEANGYAATTADSGEAGIGKAQKEKPDLVLLGHVMAGIDGDEVLARLKAGPTTKNIPVIMFTADVKKVSVVEYRLRGAEDCLFKPFTPQELLSKVRKALRQKA